MYITTVAAIAAINFATTCLASPGYLVLDFDKRATVERRLVRRQDPGDGSFVGELVQNTNKLEYLINITLGTPPQPLAVTLDTGSSDLWVPAKTNENCLKKECDGGSFDPKASSSYRLIQEGTFNITYAAPGDSDAGDWASDTLVIGGSPGIKDQQIGVALAGFDDHGVMGIGYDSNEAGTAPNGTYPSVMDNLVDQGIIARKAYSLYLNDLESNRGSVIFGGIDTTKYTGDLVALPFQGNPDEGGITEFLVTLTDVSFTDSTGKTTRLSPEGYAQAALLDSGTSETLLNTDVFDALANGFGAVDVGDSTYVVPCRFAELNGTIDYSFGGEGGPTIKVPINQVIGNQVFDSENFDDPSGACNFGFGAPIIGSVILGDTFLRNAYAVFDLDNNIGALAQAVVEKTDTSSIIVIPSGTELPGASVTAALPGTPLNAAQATEAPAVPIASAEGTTLVLTGSPTFNLGKPTGTAASAGSAAATSSHSDGANAAAPTAALLGLGLVAGVLFF